MEKSLSATFASCVQRLKEMHSDKGVELSTDKIQRGDWKQQIDRLTQWASDVGLNRKYQFSLEYRLHEDKQTRDYTTGVLRELHDLPDELEKDVARLKLENRQPEISEARETSYDLLESMVGHLENAIQLSFDVESLKDRFWLERDSSQIADEVD